MSTKAKAAQLPPARYEDWPTRLFAFIEERRNRPFEWGVQDCCLFACDGIRAQSGLDPADKMFRGKYRDATGAARLVRKHGGVEAIAEKVCAAHGMPEVPVALAQRGFVVLMDTPDGLDVALGLCVGGQAVFAGPAGLVFQPMAACRRAWRVG